MPLELTPIFEFALRGYEGTEAAKKFATDFQTKAGQAKLLAPTMAFMGERVEFYLRDVMGFAYDVVNAVLMAAKDNVVDAIARARAVTQARPSEDFEHISIAFKRIKNILRQAQETGKRIAPEYNAQHLREDAEKKLDSEMRTIAARVEPLRAQGNYSDAMVEISKLRPAVDTFFDKVMVMVEDDHLRAARLALLENLLRNFSTIADFSEIVPKEAAKAAAG